MAKILEITENIISIGMEDNSIKEVRPVDLNFIPHIGDEVEVFETETRTNRTEERTCAKTANARRRHPHQCRKYAGCCRSIYHRCQRKSCQQSCLLCPCAVAGRYRCSQILCWENRHRDLLSSVLLDRYSGYNRTYRRNLRIVQTRRCFWEYYRLSTKVASWYNNKTLSVFNELISKA